MATLGDLPTRRVPVSLLKLPREEERDMLSSSVTLPLTVGISISSFVPFNIGACMIVCGEVLLYCDTLALDTSIEGLSCLSS